MIENTINKYHRNVFKRGLILSFLEENVKYIITYLTGPLFNYHLLAIRYISRHTIVSDGSRDLVNRLQ